MPAAPVQDVVAGQDRVHEGIDHAQPEEQVLVTIPAADGFGLVHRLTPHPRHCGGDGGQLFADGCLHEWGLASDELLICHPRQSLQPPSRFGCRANPRESEVQRAPQMLSRTLRTMKRVGVEQKGAACLNEGDLLVRVGAVGIVHDETFLPRFQVAEVAAGHDAHDSFIDQGETQSGYGSGDRDYAVPTRSAACPGASAGHSRMSPETSARVRRRTLRAGRECAG